MDSDPFQGRLLQGERVVWRGAPASGFLLTQRDLFLIPISLFWCCFAIFWEWSAMHVSEGLSLLFSIPFISIGAYFVAGRFLVDAWVRERTHYAVTNQRILILRTGPTVKFTTLAIDRLPELSLNERADGRGTILFQPAEPIWNSRKISNWTPALDSSPQFLVIPDARNVFDRIQRLAQEFSARKSGYQ